MGVRINEIKNVEINDAITIIKILGHKILFIISPYLSKKLIL